MLIQFSVSNFKSIREQQTLSMVASRALKGKVENTMEAETSEKGLPPLLRCAAIFGPNASGKTNLLRALRFVEQTVMYSAGSGIDEPLQTEPFMLDEQSVERDSTFEVEFVEDGVRYQFGFDANRERITKEWLISYPKARPVELYRRMCSEGAPDEYDFGHQLEGGRLRRDWARLTGPKTLYISRVVQASGEEFQQLKVPYRWFSHRLRVITTRSFSSQLTAKMCLEPEGRDKVVAFMGAFGLPIVGVEVEQEEIDLKQMSSVFRQDALDEIFRQTKAGPPTQYEPIFLHRRTDGELIRFRKENESSGTMNLFGFASRWIPVLDQDSVLLVDELDSSLHPLVVWELINMFMESNSKAQLIFTTHDATVMRSKKLRRDQVYFVSSQRDASTRLYSLLDFKGREDDAVEDRYLQGRYGATPAIAR